MKNNNDQIKLFYDITPYAQKRAKQLLMRENNLVDFEKNNTSFKRLFKKFKDEGKMKDLDNKLLRESATKLERTTDWDNTANKKPEYFLRKYYYGYNEIITNEQRILFGYVHELYNKRNILYSNYKQKTQKYYDAYEYREKAAAFFVKALKSINDEEIFGDIKTRLVCCLEILKENIHPYELDSTAYGYLKEFGAWLNDYISIKNDLKIVNPTLISFTKFNPQNAVEVATKLSNCSNELPLGELS